MKTILRDRRGAWTGFLPTVVAMLLVLAAAVPARAQTETLPTEGLEESEALVDDLLSPVPTDDVEGTLNDTIGEVTEPGAPKPAPGGGGEEGSGSPGSTNDGTTGSGDATNAGTATGDAAGSSGARATADDGGSAGGSTTGMDPTTAADVVPSYQTLAAKGTGAALRRAAQLAGPLAPPLALGAIAIMVLIGIARGSDRLVKIEESSLGPRVYRL